MIIESLANSDHQVQYDKTQPSTRGILELGARDAILAQIKVIS